MADDPMADTLRAIGLAVTRESILAYAEITGDWNPIHVDADFAAASPTGGIIAHGTMSLNLLWQSIAATLGADAPHRTTLDVRFVRPVRIGDTVSAGGRRRGDAPAVWEVWVRNGAGEPVIAGTATLDDPL